ncbi:MAG TPA: polyphosphate kinase 2 family protein [Candidatus Acidoferrales bacterium]|nr:polyphosphate kinase 2 family protein [Candidatus Acidoferrales bacterium]
MNFTKKLRVRPGTKIKLRDWDPDDTLGYKKDGDSKKLTDKTIERLDKLQYLLYAENRHSLLIVLQGMDAAGKDGTIRHVMAGVNPQGCTVTSFKVPSHEEAQHDFLWRAHKAVPGLGDIGIFNRSHYEDVLVVRVHKLVPKHVWEQRYDEINQFEKILHENNTVILKFFLHISKGEQKKRFEERLSDPDHNWKASPADFVERKYWDEYTVAYEDALSRCSKKDAPWFVIPSDHKWFRNLAVSRIVTETLEEMHLKFPKPKFDLSKIKIR